MNIKYVYKKKYIDNITFLNTHFYTPRIHLFIENRKDLI